MNDGGNHQLRNVRKPGGDGYARAIAKVAVTQVCENEGFQTFQQSALETLSNVTVRYIRDMGRAALSYANLAGRSQVNHFDIIQGLEDLSSVQGFPSSSEIDHCLTNSGVVCEILQYISDYEEVPFVYDIPRFPIDRDRKRSQSFLQVGVVPPDEHIPEWLPAFPDPKSYDVSLKESDGLPGSRVDDDGDMQFLQQHEKSQTQLTLSKASHFLSSNELARPSSADVGNLDKLNEAGSLYPYLLAPVKFAEKEASPATTLPEKPSWDSDERNALEMKQNADRNTVAEEISEPANEVASSKLSAARDVKLFSSQRPCVRFKIKIGKKMDVSSRVPCNDFVDKSSQLICQSDANNDVKERALKILKESMEITLDVA